MSHTTITFPGETTFAYDGPAGEVPRLADQIGNKFDNFLPKVSHTLGDTAPWLQGTATDPFSAQFVQYAAFGIALIAALKFGKPVMGMLGSLPGFRTLASGWGAVTGIPLIGGLLRFTTGLALALSIAFGVSNWVSQGHMEFKAGTIVTSIGSGFQDTAGYAIGAGKQIIEVAAGKALFNDTSTNTITTPLVLTAPKHGA